jgi:hypothetical protein
MPWKIEYGQNYYKNNREEVLRRNRERYAANPDKDREKHLKRKYGITLKEYNDILKSQNGQCKLCLGPPTGKGNLHVDHDHKTGRIRGLLCNTCNAGLGNFKDDLNLLYKAIEYLNGNN